MTSSLELPRTRVSTTQAPFPLTPDIKNQTKTNNSIIRPGPWGLFRGEWEVKHCGRDKFSSEITPAPPQDFLDKETGKGKTKFLWKGKLQTLPPVKSFMLSSLYIDKCSSLCYLNNTYQTTSLPPRATPNYPKKLHSVLISYAHFGEGVVSYSW